MSLTIGEIDGFLVEIRVARARLQDTNDRLQKMSKELFQRCVDAKVEENETRAIIYANECAAVRKFSACLTQAIGAVDKTIEALLALEKISPNPKRPC